MCSLSGVPCRSQNALQACIALAICSWSAAAYLYIWVPWDLCLVQELAKFDHAIIDLHLGQGLHDMARSGPYSSLQWLLYGQGACRLDVDTPRPQLR